MQETAELSRALGTLYDSVINPNLWDEALSKLTHFVGGDSALVFYQDRVAKTGDFVKSFNADGYWTKLYFEKYVALNPAIPYLAFTDVGSVLSFQQVIPHAEMLESVFYHEWMQPQDYWDVVITILEKDANVSGMFGVNQRRADGAATQGHRDRMEMISPHMRRAVSFARLFAGLSSHNMALSSVIELADAPVVFLDPEARVTFANAAAKQAAAQGAPFALDNGQLGGVADKAGQALADAVGSIRNGDASGGAQSIAIGDGWTANVMPVAPGARMSNGTAAIVSLTKTRPGDPAPMDALVARFGFTPRELQVFLGIVQFGGVPEVAQMFGLAPTTVRTHLQRVFDKTGVRDQRDLIRIAMTHLGPPPGASGRA
jgi:DNA-binding CsgD family transcriptional regulator